MSMKTSSQDGRMVNKLSILSGAGLLFHASYALYIPRSPACNREKTASMLLAAPHAWDV